MAFYTPPLVFYHRGCVDGFVSAWVAHKAFREESKYPCGWAEDALYIPCGYQEEPPARELYKDRDVFILDFSFSRDVLLEICSYATSLVLLDHHGTARERLANFPTEVQRPDGGVTPVTVVFDMTKSGALLSWEHFFPDKVKAVPWLIRYVMDRDLWTWRLPLSREINASLYSYPFDFDVWDNINRFAHHTTLAEQGRHILRYEDKLVDQGVRYAREVMLDGHKVLAFNTPFLQSEIAGKLAEQEGRDFGVCWSQQKDGRYRIDLRSRNDFDVSQIAKKFGGGGHKNAAGMTVEALPFEQARVSGANPATDLPCEWCQEVKPTAVHELWSKSDPKGYFRRLCGACVERCAGS